LHFGIPLFDEIFDMLGKLTVPRLTNMENVETPARNQKPPLLANPAIQLVLAWISVLLLGWPLIQIVGEHGMAAMFLYVFVVWGGLIVLLFAVSRSLRRALRSAMDSDDSTGKRR